MTWKPILGWIWAIVGRILLYGTAMLIIALLLVRQQMEERGRFRQGMSRGGWRGDREPVERVIPPINHAYDESLRTQLDHYPLRVCVVDGRDLDALGGVLDYDHDGLLVRLCCEDCLDVFLGEPLHYYRPLLEAAPSLEGFSADLTP